MDTSKVRHKDGPPGYTCPNFRPVQERTLNETEHGSGVAGWNCRGHRLVRVGLFYLHKDGAVLRGHAEEGALPRPAPLPSFCGRVDRVAVRHVHPAGAPLRVEPDYGGRGSANRD